MPCHNGGVCNQVTIIYQLSGVSLTNICQDPTGTSWFCSCAPGYTGPLCERQVCSANPCLHGGTCLGSQDHQGFICLCGAGRRGGRCEEEVSLHQPSFTSWVAGYSSFLTYQTPPDVGLFFEAKFHFTTTIINQVEILPLNETKYLIFLS